MTIFIVIIYNYYQIWLKLPFQNHNLIKYESFHCTIFFVFFLAIFPVRSTWLARVICCLFRQQTQHLLTSWWPGTPKGLCGNYVENVDFWLFDPKNHFKVFDRRTNIAGDRLDILFHFPNDWYKNIGGKIEKKMKLELLHLPKIHWNGM